MSFKFLSKCSPNKKRFHPSLKGPRKGASPYSPKWGSYGERIPQYASPLSGYQVEPIWREMPISRAFIYIQVPGK
jgi:hypothetical protein